jgi:hypothetical protein
MGGNPLPPLFEGRALIGWMPEEVATKFLLEDCEFDPAITRERAAEIWREHRTRAAAIPERDAPAPERIALDQDEQHHAARFMRFLNSIGPHGIVEVAKFDLSRLVIHQLYVAAERSEGYRNRVATVDGWLTECLPLQVRPPVQISGQVTVNGANTSADFDIPHGEFALLPIQAGNQAGIVFSVQQYLNYVSVIPSNNRMILKAGYHRSFARAVSMLPTATVPSAVVAVERSVVVAPPNQAAGAGLNAAAAELDFSPLGRRPPLLGDFFNDNLFMRVTLRRKRYQLQVRSTWKAIDHP